MAKPNFSILLPPSRGKQSGGNPFAPDMFDYRASTTFNFFNELNPARRKLIDAMHEAIDQGDDLEDVFGVKGETLEEAIEINKEIYSAPLMSAHDRFSPGVMFEAMDFPGLPTGAQRRLLENGIIFSGVFGILRPDDLIANHRLPMDADLPEVGKVYQYWREEMSPILNRALQGRFVWNLLSRSYERAWTDEETYDHMVEVKFYDEKANGDRRAVSHNVKTLRGQLVNFIVRESVEEIEPLRNWWHPSGYRFDEEASEIDLDGKQSTLVMVNKEGEEKEAYLAQFEEE